ncbi:hypothetical protein PaecuDRAFT_1975 [Paenibacillus curdlanolyticus YK9]|uniref:Uncharacterized protein n=1 Tax=Paenibacillus curdlanolyticus YK9 TaxID=717606 RepID=E0I8M2_9BACL|nr:hypothetical protein [Paenibacillus curdlanolyticus]EFM11527.1 hypothetical protein PaecuDRAFT_1975 [Paenibacillus curdlanolyticus YK9]
MNYLKLCGAIAHNGQRYDAPFQPDVYPHDRKATSVRKALPLYLIIEALAQIGCRSAAEALHTTARIIPVQLRNFRMEKEVAQGDGPYRLQAALKENGRQIALDTLLIDSRGNTAVSAELWVSVMAASGA